MSATSEDTVGADTRHPPTILGWFVRFGSVALILLLAGTILWKMAFASTDVTFTAKIAQDDVRREGSDYYLPIEVTNEGSKAVRNVALDLVVDGEKTSTEIDLIGARETVRKMVVRNAPGGDVQVEVSSYEMP